MFKRLITDHQSGNYMMYELQPSGMLISQNGTKCISDGTKCISDDYVTWPYDHIIHSICYYVWYATTHCIKYTYITNI